MSARPSGIRPPSIVKSSSTLSNASTTASSSRMPVPTSRPSTATPTTPTAKNEDLNGRSSREESPDVEAGESFMIGDTVWIDGLKRGRVAYIGTTQFAKGEWVGVCLDAPEGKNDGSVSGVRYFQCEMSHGTFCRPSRLAKRPSTAVDPSKECDVHGSTPPRCLADKQRSPSPMSNSPSPGVTRMGSPSPINIGERVIVSSSTGSKCGVLRYYGPTSFANGTWAGIELEYPMGKNDGSVGGQRYFTCRDRYGLFAPAHKISRSPANRKPSSNLRRQGSRESMVSNVSNISSLTSSVTPRSTRKPARASSGHRCLPTCSAQAVLTEKEQHIEQLLKERDLDRNELAAVTSQYEQCVQELKTVRQEYLQYKDEASSKLIAAAGEQETIKTLKLQLEEEKKNYEDLLFNLEEEKIAKSDLQSQVDSIVSSDDRLKEKETELEDLRQKLDSTAKQLLQVTAQLTKKTNELETLTLENKHLNESIQNHETTEIRLQTQVDKLQHEVETLKKDHDEFLNGVHNVQVNQLNALVSQRTDEVSKLVEEKENLQQNVEQISGDLSKLKNEYVGLQEKNSRLETEISNLVNSKSSSNEVLVSQLKEKDTELAALTAKLETESVERQRERKELQEKLSVEKNNWSSREKDLLKSAEETCARVKQLEAELVSSQKKFEELSRSHEVDISTLKGEMENRVSNAQSHSIQIQEKIDQLKGEIELRDKELDKLQSRLNEEENEKQRIIKEKNDVMLECENLGKSLKKQEGMLKSQLETMSTSCRSLEEDCSAKKDTIEELKKEINSLQGKIDVLEGNSSGMTKEREAALKKLEELEKQCDSLKNENCQLHNKASEAAAELEKIKTGAVNECTDLRIQLKTNAEKVVSLEGYKRQQEEEIHFLKGQVENLTQQISAIKSAQEKQVAPDPESSTAKYESQIQFLNSIIVDLKRKNEECNQKIDVLLRGETLPDANSNDVRGKSESHRVANQNLRLYCDICEMFDSHDTDDCPKQASESTDSHHHAPRGQSRPYCANCEVFGHTTEECDDAETF